MPDFPDSWPAFRRIELGLSQGELAKHSGLSRAAINRIEGALERGEHPSRSAAAKIEAVLGPVFEEDFPLSPGEAAERYRMHVREKRQQALADAEFSKEMERIGEDVEGLDDWDSPVVITDDGVLVIDGSRLPSKIERAEASVEQNQRSLDRARSQNRETAIQERNMRRAERRLEAALQSIQRAQSNFVKGHEGRARESKPRAQRTKRQRASKSSSDDPGEPEPEPELGPPGRTNFAVPAIAEEARARRRRLLRPASGAARFRGAR